MKYSVAFVLLLLLLNRVFVTGVVSKEGLVLHLEASNPGSQYGNAWHPVISQTGRGGFFSKGGAPFPQHSYDVSGDEYTGYYRFSPSSSAASLVCSLGGGLNFDYRDNFTIEAWIRVAGASPAPDGSGRGIILTNHDGSRGYRFAVRRLSGSQYYFEMLMQDPSASFQRISDLRTYSDQNWVHVAMTYSGSGGGTPAINIYINGVLRNFQFTGSGSSSPDYVPQSHFLSIGDCFSSVPVVHPFNGDINTLRVYNRALTSSEITSNYNSGLSKTESLFLHDPKAYPGLVLDMDAARAGYLRQESWQPDKGNFDGGLLMNITDPQSGVDNTPARRYEACDSNSTQLIPFYRFSATPADEGHHGGGGMVAAHAKEICFDYDKTFCVEVWFRATQPSNEPAPGNGRGILFSTQSMTANGYRLNVRTDGADPTQFYIESQLRDNSGQVRKMFGLNSSRLPFSEEWVHIFLKYQGNTNAPPTQTIYVNGQIDTGASTYCAGDCEDFSENDFIAGQPVASMGGRDSYHTITDYASSAQYYGGAGDTRLWFTGDIAAVRVWENALSDEQIANNYRWGLPKIQRRLNGDLTSDGRVTILDLAEFTYGWLGDAFEKPKLDLNIDGKIDYPDFNVISQNWSKQETSAADFMTMFNNDTTHILSCVSPYHAAGERFRSEMIDSSVDETADTGIDVHLLSPGLGRVPFWQSDVLPIWKHYNWFSQAYGILATTAYLNEVLAGGDIVQQFVDRCRNKGISPFISYRVNDHHHLELIYNTPPPSTRADVLCQFYYDHPDYRLGDNLNNQYERIHNWVHPEPREYIFKFIEELCANYDIDGLELDFMRRDAYFNLNETTSQQRRAIMTNFVRRVRNMLDETSPLNKHRWLCVRIPNQLTTLDYLGIDLAALEQAGVDLFNMTNTYYTEQQTDIRQAKAMLDRAKIFSEVHFTVGYVPVGTDVGWMPYSGLCLRQTTPEMYYTAAHLAYNDGADGISAFNIQYYREHDSRNWEGPWNEPPFEVFEILRDPVLVAQEPQHYVISNTGQGPYLRSVPPLHATLDPGQSRTISLTMVPPTGGWTHDGKLRIMAMQNLDGASFAVKINGTALTEISDVSEPYENPYLAGQGDSEQFKAWSVPHEILLDGQNTIQITSNNSTAYDLYYLDIAVR